MRKPWLVHPQPPSAHNYLVVMKPLGECIPHGLPLRGFAWFAAPFGFPRTLDKSAVFSNIPKSVLLARPNDYCETTHSTNASSFSIAPTSHSSRQREPEPMKRHIPSYPEKDKDTQAKADLTVGDEPPKLEELLRWLVLRLSC